MYWCCLQHQQSDINFEITALCVTVSYIFSDIVIFHPKRLHNKFEDAQTRYDGNYDTEKIKKFLSTQM